jgi:cytochrome c-type biogenesis protein CcmH/NrfG
MNRDRVDEAVPHFQRAARLNPDSPRLHFELGLALAMSGDMRAAADEASLLDRLDATTAARLRQELVALATDNPE